MKLKDALQNYYDFSGKTSDIARQMGLAGVAIIWLFKAGPESSIAKIPADLKIPLILIGVGLACDLIQYAASTAIWGFYHRHKEKNTGEDDVFTANPKINAPGIVFFVAKIAAIGVAYGYLIAYVSRTIF
jgi:hypothetical protein